MEYNNNNPPPVGAPPYHAEAEQQAQQVQATATATATATTTTSTRIRLLSLVVMLEYIARGGAILTTFLATVIVAASKQTLSVVGLDLLLQINTDSVTVKFSNFSAFKYFLAANIIVLFYSIASLVMSIIIKSKTLILKLSNTIGDIVAVSLLLTANGAAIAISTQFNDIDHFFGGSLCSALQLDKFCSHVKASIAMSMLAVALYLALIILTFLNFANNKN